MSDPTPASRLRVQNSGEIPRDGVSSCVRQTTAIPAVDITCHGNAFRDVRIETATYPISEDSANVAKAVMKTNALTDFNGHSGS